MIEATDLTKTYGPTVAVNGLTFTVRPGQVTGFLGPNGAGKSTTMRMILGLDHPTRGTVIVGGRPYGQLHRPLHQIGAVLEVGAVHPGRSAAHHLLSVAQASGIPASRVTEVLELVGILGVSRKRVGRFSLGMRQRLGLAAALLGDPPIVICDEPVNGLDPEGILWIRTLLRDLAAQGRTVFVSSHLMSEMALTADHLIVIGQGRLLADASTRTILATHSDSYVLLRTRDPDRLTDLLRQAGATVTTSTSTSTSTSTNEQPDSTHRATPVLHVSGLPADAIGDLAADNRIAILQLTPHQASLEQAYLKLTRDHTDFRTEPTPTAQPTGGNTATGSGH